MIRFLKRRVTGGYLPCRGSVIVLLAFFVIVGSVFFIHSSWNKGRGVVRPPTYNRKDDIQDICSNPICVPRKECHKQEVRRCQPTKMYKHFCSNNSTLREQIIVFILSIIFRTGIRALRTYHAGSIRTSRKI